jgi:hypothetical protein
VYHRKIDKHVVPFLSSAYEIQSHEKPIKNHSDPTYGKIKQVITFLHGMTK